MVMVLFSNGTIAQQYQLEGNATQQMVDTVPGIEYRVTVSVSNQDGTNTTAPVPFQTAPGRKYQQWPMQQYLLSTIYRNGYVLCT